MAVHRGWRRIGDFLFSPTGRLAASYLAVIMVMSLGFSYVLYSTSAHELRRQAPPSGLYRDESGKFDDAFTPPERVNDFLKRRGEEARQALLRRLLLLNGCTLLAGAGLSYYLARRTLRPIEMNIEAQSQFVGDASHELRTPLTALQTSNEVALRDRHLTLQESRSVLKQNVEEVAKLQALTDSLLKLARQDSESLPLKDTSLQDVAGDAMNRVIDQAQARQMSIDETVPAVMVQAHSSSLTQAVVILLDNAIKYSQSGTAIRLTGGKKGKHAYIRVIDRGPGIRPSDVRRIFDRFYRADQSRSSRHVSGHGIGLSLAQKIVEQHGGTIDVVSEVGKGSIFTIILPAA